jgi:hypothetical protein
MIVASLPVAPVVASVRVVPISPVVITVVITVAAGMNGGMTGMDGTGVRRGNTDEGNQEQTQCVYCFHGIYCYSVNCRPTLGVSDARFRYAFRRIDCKAN